MLLNQITPILLITVAIVLPLLYARVYSGGRSIRLRRMPAVEGLNQALVRAAESGKPVHLAPGSGALHGVDIAPETFAGLVLAQTMANVATRRGATVIASSGDAVTHLALRGAIHTAYRDAGYSDDYKPNEIELFADHNALAFAAGQAQRLKAQPMEASIEVGAFGESFLLIGEQGRQSGIEQLAGTTQPSSLAAAVLTANHVLYGEEIYVAEAYIAPTTLGTARIMSHDMLRYIIIGLLLLGVTLALLRDFSILDPTKIPLLRGL